MKNPYNKYDEFGSPPEEFYSGEEYEKVCGTPGTTPTSDSIAPEDQVSAPEITGPGEYIYTQRKKKSKKHIKKMLYIAAAIYVMFFSFNMTGTDFFGSIKEITDAAEEIVNSGDITTPAEESSAEAETTAPVDDTSVPQCDIVAFAFYSEQHVELTFSDMSRAKKVSLEYRDPYFDETAKTADITKTALSTLKYSPGAFDTTFLFDAHPDYYSQTGVDYPMSVEVRVIIDYGENEQVTYSATTVQETSGGYFMKYLTDADAADIPDYPRGCILIMTEPTHEYPDPQVFINEPEKVTGPGMVSVSVTIDGKPLNAADYTLNTYNGEGVIFSGYIDPISVTYNDVIIFRPADIPEGPDHFAHISVTHYLSSRDEVITSEYDLAFVGHN